MFRTVFRALPNTQLYARAVVLAFVLTSLCAPLAALATPPQQGLGYGPTIYVPNDGFATVTFRDASSLDVRATAYLPTPNTSAINHSPDGSLLFLTSQGFTHQLEIVDVATQSVIAGVELPFRGLSNCNASSVLPVNGNMKIYVACEGHGHVEVAHFDPSTNALTLGTPIFVGWPQSLQQVGGYVFVSDTQFNKLKRIDPQTDVVEEVIPHQSYIFGDAVVDPFRPYAYIINQFGKRLLIANTFTHGISRTLEFDGELIDLLLAPDGDRLYVTVDGGNGDDYIAVVDGLGEAESVVATIPVGPAANYLASNDEGTCLYTWDFVGGTRRVAVIDTTHNLVSAQPVVAGGDANGDFVGPGASTQAVYLEPNSDNQNSFAVGEGAGSIQVAVRRSCSAQGTVQVSYATQAGSNGDAAVAGQDYAATSGVLEFADGEFVKTIDIPIFDNTLYGQPARYFDLILHDPAGALLGERAVDTIRIDDDDPIPAGNDLDLSLSAYPDPAIARGELTYYLYVSNYPTNGGAAAHDVLVVNDLPAGVAFTSVEMTIDAGGGGGGDFFGAVVAGPGAANIRAMAEQPGEIPQPGSCAAPAVGETGTVVCNVGTLNPAYDGASASIEIRVTVLPEAVDSDLVDAANVTTSSLDPYTENNGASITTRVEAPGVTPILYSIAPTSVLANGSAFDLTVQGDAFFDTATVQINGAEQTTTFVNAQQLVASVPGYEIASYVDVYVLPVTVVNPAPGGGVSNPQALAVVSDKVAAVQAAVAEAGAALYVSTAPQGAGAAGVTIDLANQTPGTDDIAFAAATYNGNPTATAFPGDVGGGFVDVYVVGAEDSDSATANFYYASAVSAADEADMNLFYFDGYQWAPVLSSGGSDPVKDSTDNLGGTVSGGRFTVIFDSTSTPSICTNGYCGGGESYSVVIDDLSATVFTMGSSPQPNNNSPAANGQEVNTDEDTAANITLTGSDVDGDALSYTVLTLPAHGLLSGIAPNVVYTPDANFNGSDSFTFQVNDGQAGSNVATVNIMVSPVNDPPSANGQEVNADEDTATNITLTGSDVDGDALSYTVLTPPAHGSLSGDAPDVVYTPAANYHGGDSFTFQMNDSQAGSNVATVSITVSPVNDNPTAGNDSATTAQDNPVAIAVRVNDSDVDGDVLTVTAVNAAAHGSATTDGSTVTYTPAPGYTGNDNLMYMVGDGHGGGAMATVQITVTPSQPLTATITIIKDAQPDKPRRFRFTGSLGTFRLSDDGSNTENDRTFTVNTGVYTVTERVPGGWFLTDIVCTPTANAAVDLAASKVVVTAAGGDNITCTFVNQKAAIIRAFLFQDTNRNGTRQGREPVNVGWTVNLLDSQGQLVASAVTNQQGKVSFTNVQPGAYTVCEVLQNGLANPQPCAAIQALPAETTAITFANLNAGGVRSAGADQLVSQFASLDSEEPDTDEAIMPNDDAWLSSEAPVVADAGELTKQLYLPVVTR